MYFFNDHPSGTPVNASSRKLCPVLLKPEYKFDNYSFFARDNCSCFKIKDHKKTGKAAADTGVRDSRVVYEWHQILLFRLLNKVLWFLHLCDLLINLEGSNSKPHTSK
jgi:hypothetical protein